jgi:hypothetical protein
MNRRLLTFAGVAAAVLWASTANAATITIGFQQAGVNSGNITTLTSGVAGVANVNNLAYGTFTLNTVDGTGKPLTPGNQLLVSNALDISGTTGGTLNVYVTSQGNTLATPGFTSFFTENTLESGWTVTEQTFLDTGNGLFTTSGLGVTALGTAIFSAIGTSVAGALASAGPGLYSVTELFTIVATGAGTAQSTINLVATPLPGALPLFATGLLGLWALRRKRKAKSAESLDPVVA